LWRPTKSPAASQALFNDYLLEQHGLHLKMGATRAGGTQLHFVQSERQSARCRRKVIFCGIGPRAFA
jgi:hypothetical protein